MNKSFIKSIDGNIIRGNYKKLNCNDKESTANLLYFSNADESVVITVYVDDNSMARKGLINKLYYCQNWYYKKCRIVRIDGNEPYIESKIEIFLKGHINISCIEKTTHKKLQATKEFLEDILNSIGAIKNE